MKNKMFSVFCLLLVGYFLYADTNFGEVIIISSAVNEARCINAADIDNDGNIDVLSASIDDSKVAWYKNDGNCNFPGQLVISDTLYWANSVHPVDLDNDGDLDVLASAWIIDAVVWYENRDSMGSFSDQKVIRSAMTFKGTLGGNSITAADLDDDGDQDVLFASHSDGVESNGIIIWYENDGNGNFSEEKNITDSVHTPNAVCTADIDGDNDQDVLSASAWDNKIAWYENDSSGVFSEQNIITTQAAQAWSVFAADLDGDGDKDVLSASSDDDKIAWYENTDGAGVFSEQILITTPNEFTMPRAVAAADLDNDGDNDVVYGSNDGVYWNENLDGNGNFSDFKVIDALEDVVKSIKIIDLDEDGDNDVLVAYQNMYLAWYENLFESSIEDQMLPSKTTLYQNYPNPFNPTTEVKFALPSAGYVKLNVYNINGQLILELVNGNKEAGEHKINFDARDFNSGIYFYKLEANGISLTKKMILVK